MLAALTKSGRPTRAHNNLAGRRGGLGPGAGPARQLVAVPLSRFPRPAPRQITWRTQLN